MPRAWNSVTIGIKAEVLELSYNFKIPRECVVVIPIAYAPIEYLLETFWISTSQFCYITCFIFQVRFYKNTNYILRSSTVKITVSI